MSNSFINAFSKKVNAEQERINAEVKIMREGLGEILYLNAKLAGNMDEYMSNARILSKSLTDGYYDFNNDKGQPVPRFKPFAEQHKILTSLIEMMTAEHGDNLSHDLSIAGLSRLAESRKIRKAQRYMGSGYAQERNEFEGVKPESQYAGNLNDRGEQTKMSDKRSLNGEATGTRRVTREQWLQAKANNNASRQGGGLLSDSERIIIK